MAERNSSARRVHGKKRSTELDMERIERRVAAWEWGAPSHPADRHHDGRHRRHRQAEQTHHSFLAGVHRPLKEPAVRGLRQAAVQAGNLVIRGNNGNVLIVPKLVVSDRSDKPTKDNMAGLVLWQYKNLEQWITCGVPCHSGMVYIKRSANIVQNNCEGVVHGNLFMDLFKQRPGCKMDMLVTGFSWFQQEARFVSGTLNCRRKTWQNNYAEASYLEKKLLKYVFLQWYSTGQKEFLVKHIPL